MVLSKSKREGCETLGFLGLKVVSDARGIRWTELGLVVLATALLLPILTASPSVKSDSVTTTDVRLKMWL